MVFTRQTQGSKSYDVIFHASLRSGAVLTPPVVAEFNHSFSFVRSLACDVPLGDHPGEYDMHEKFAKLHPGGPNPFIDRAGCNEETDIEDAMFHAILQEQEQAALAAAKP